MRQYPPEHVHQEINCHQKFRELDFANNLYQFIKVTSPNIEIPCARTNHIVTSKRRKRWLAKLCLYAMEPDTESGMNVLTLWGDWRWFCV